MQENTVGGMSTESFFKDYGKWCIKYYLYHKKNSNP